MTERRFRHDPEDMWWLPRASCIGVDPELFFPVGTSDPALAQVEAAKSICGGCAVRAECLEWSLRRTGRGRLGRSRRGGAPGDPTGPSTRRRRTRVLQPRV